MIGPPWHSRHAKLGALERVTPKEERRSPNLPQRSTPSALLLCCSSPLPLPPTPEVYPPRRAFPLRDTPIHPRVAKVNSDFLLTAPPHPPIGIFRHRRQRGVGSAAREPRASTSYHNAWPKATTRWGLPFSRSSALPFSPSGLRLSTLPSAVSSGSNGDSRLFPVAKSRLPTPLQICYSAFAHDPSATLLDNRKTTSEPTRAHFEETQNHRGDYWAPSNQRLQKRRKIATGDQN
jgi:hypothetical protein